MRKIIIFLLALLFIPASLQSQTKKLRIGYTGGYPLNWDTGAYDTSKVFNWQMYKELSMNAWASWRIEGAQTEVLDSLEANDMDGLFEPDTMVFRAAYGRISIYEAEDDYSGRFRYNNHHSTGTPINDNWQGQTPRVQFYDASSSPTTILSGLEENGEQVFSGLGIPVKGPNVSWYIKPRMRITTADALGTIKNVCKIIIKAYDGTTTEFILDTRAFRDTSSSTYDGRYLEEYDGVSMIVTGNFLTQGLPSDFPQENPPPFASNAVDYQIYWYGEVDLWIDYVKVMDNVAEDYYAADPTVRNYIERFAGN